MSAPTMNAAMPPLPSVAACAAFMLITPGSYQSAEDAHPATKAAPTTTHCHCIRTR